MRVVRAGSLAPQRDRAVPSQAGTGRARLAEARGIPLHVLLGQPRAAQGPRRAGAAGRAPGRTGSWKAAMYQLRRAWSPWRMAHAMRAVVRCRQHGEAAQPLGVSLGEGPRHRAAPVVADEVHARTAECVEQGEHVADQLLHPVGRRPPGSAPAASSRAGRRPPPAARRRRAAGSPATTCGGPGASRAAARPPRPSPVAGLAAPATLSLTSKTRPSRVNSSTPRTYPAAPRHPCAGGVRRCGTMGRDQTRRPVPPRRTAGVDRVCRVGVGLRARGLPPQLARCGGPARERAVRHRGHPAVGVHDGAAARLRRHADPGGGAARPVRVQAAAAVRRHPDDRGAAGLRVSPTRSPSASSRGSSSGSATP